MAGLCAGRGHQSARLCRCGAGGTGVGADRAGPVAAAQRTRFSTKVRPLLPFIQRILYLFSGKSARKYGIYSALITFLALG